VAACAAAENAENLDELRETGTGRLAALELANSAAAASEVIARSMVRSSWLNPAVGWPTKRRTPAHAAERPARADASAMDSIPPLGRCCTGTGSSGSAWSASTGIRG